MALHDYEWDRVGQKDIGYDRTGRDGTWFGSIRL